MAAARGRIGAALPQPTLPRPTPWRGLFAGIGGGGIVTAGAILAMAAHLEGREVRTLDFTGLAQKNGAVVAHVQIADTAAELDVVRIPLGTADLMIAADLAVGCAAGVLERSAEVRCRDRQSGPRRHRRVQAGSACCRSTRCCTGAP